MTRSSPVDANRLRQAKALAQALERDDHVEADRLLDELAEARDALLFQELGRLTRQLHEAMTGFSLDSRLAELAERDIPDAKERLNYVVTMTEQAANTTLNAIDEILPVTDKLSGEASELADQWTRFLQREMPFDEFKSMSQHLGDHFVTTRDGLGLIQGKLNEVLMAQGFQDITGQIIKRVILLVQDVELNMVELIRIAGKRAPLAVSTAGEEPHDFVPGPVVPGVDDRQGDTVASQDDVDDLLSSLGF
ncbi:MAG TPA: protein phosphatase CheZ [Methylococcaceae bacterium]|nr:protein phosphatase CheZ [Methylococcaceae bacterium]